MFKRLPALRILRFSTPTAQQQIRTKMSSTGSASEQFHHSRVVAGYKATLSNPRTSEAAKAHARSELQALEAYSTDADRASHNNRVLGGFKATLSNPNTSREAKEHALEVLAAAGEIEEGPDIGGSRTEDEHLHRVIGGYKATLHNPNTSKEAKSHAREVLSEI